VCAGSAIEAGGSDGDRELTALGVCVRDIDAVGADAITKFPVVLEHRRFGASLRQHGTES